MENEMTNPAVIMLINMTIVFAVLVLLNLFIRLIHFIDPTKEKKAPAAAPKAAPRKAAPAKAAAPAPVVAAGVSGETVAAIAGALAAAYGIGFSQIRAIRPAARNSWTGAARIDGLRNSK